MGSISRMREMLEHDLRRGVTLITWAPTFALARFANAISLSVAGVEVPWIIPWGTIVKAVLVTLSVCVCAAIQPARTAAKDNVLEALQVE
ncbi:MAG: ABC transporter permease [Phycisphaerae bacterium]|nr:MAG: ABC transporter permease [Phycisphaerae bacterium]